MSNLASVQQQILAECREDYVGLWAIVRKVRDYGITTYPEIANVTLGLITSMLSESNIGAGQFEGLKFNEWHIPIQEIVAQTERQWTALGRDPNVGEIVWFTFRC